MRVHQRTLAAAAALLLLVAACGDGDDPAPEDAAAATTDEAEAEPEAADEPAEAEETDAQADADDEPANGFDRTDWPDELVFGAVPAEGQEALVESFQPMLDAVSDLIDVEIELISATDYAGVVEAIIAERAQLAFFGPFAYVIATIGGADIEPIGAVIDAPGEEPGYQSFLIARSDNDEVNSITDVEGRTVCLVDPASTSGGLFPAAMLLAEDLDPDTDMTSTYVGAHDSSVLAVMSGDCEAGFAFDTMVTRVLPESGEIEAGDVKIVAESEIIPGSPIAMGNFLPESLKEALREAFTTANAEYLAAEGYCDEPVTDDGGRTVCPITDENRYGITPVDDAYYDGIRQVCELTGAAACES